MKISSQICTVSRVNVCDTKGCFLLDTYRLHHGLENFPFKCLFRPLWEDSYDRNKQAVVHCSSTPPSRCLLALRGWRVSRDQPEDALVMATINSSKRRRKIHGKTELLRPQRAVEYLPGTGRLWHFWNSMFPQQWYCGLHKHTGIPLSLQSDVCVRGRWQSNCQRDECPLEDGWSWWTVLRHQLRRCCALRRPYRSKDY